MSHSDLLGRLGRVPRPLIWFALFAAPLAWFVQIDLGLAFSGLVCGGHPLPMILLHALVLLVTLAALASALWLRALSSQPEGPPTRLTRYLGRYGGWQNALFLLLTLLTALTDLFLPACPLR